MIILHDQRGRPAAAEGGAGSAQMVSGEQVRTTLYRPAAVLSRTLDRHGSQRPTSKSPPADRGHRTHLTIGLYSRPACFGIDRSRHLS